MNGRKVKSARPASGIAGLLLLLLQIDYLNVLNANLIRPSSVEAFWKMHWRRQQNNDAIEEQVRFLTFPSKTKKGKEKGKKNLQKHCGISIVGNINSHRAITPPLSIDCSNTSTPTVPDCWPYIVWGSRLKWLARLTDKPTNIHIHAC